MSVLSGLRVAACACLAALPAGKALAAEKSQYSFFDPTPRHLMREMTTDRPDITEVPFTVDAGHVQTESTLVGYARTRPDADGAESDAYEFAATNLRLGLTNDVELSLVWQPYGIVETNGTGLQSLARQHGIGSLDIRAKINLWGNDDFQTVGSALAVLPVVTVPTDSSNGIGAVDVEGGMAVLAAFVLPAGFGFGINAGAYAMSDEDASGRHAEYTASASASYDWSDAFATYAEIAGVFGLDDARGDIVIVGGGFTFALTEDVQLDGGMNIGLTSASDRYNPFLGLSMRF